MKLVKSSSSLLHLHAQVSKARSELIPPIEELAKSLLITTPTNIYTFITEEYLPNRSNGLYSPSNFPFDPVAAAYLARINNGTAVLPRKSQTSQSVVDMPSPCHPTPVVLNAMVRSLCKESTTAEPDVYVARVMSLFEVINDGVNYGHDILTRSREMQDENPEAFEAISEEQMNEFLNTGIHRKLYLLMEAILNKSEALAKLAENVTQSTGIPNPVPDVSEIQDIAGAGSSLLGTQASSLVLIPTWLTEIVPAIANEMCSTGSTNQLSLQNVPARPDNRGVQQDVAPYQMPPELHDIHHHVQIIRRVFWGEAGVFDEPIHAGVIWTVVMTVFYIIRIVFHIIRTWWI